MRFAAHIQRDVLALNEVNFNVFLRFIKLSVNRYIWARQVTFKVVRFLESDMISRQTDVKVNYFSSLTIDRANLSNRMVHNGTNRGLLLKSRL